MKHGEKKYQRLDLLKALPGKILAFRDQQNVTEFVLHELCKESCFDIAKAAYFIDNPDFNCLRGLAGFDRAELHGVNYDNIWQDSHTFSEHMRGSSFNQRVRAYAQESLRKKGQADEAIVHALAHDLDLETPGFIAWEMKNDNHGLFVFQKQKEFEDVLDDLRDALSLLSFCPLF